jgi:hypothetical protein
MSNLVNVCIDLTSGNLVASGSGGANTSGSTTKGYVYQPSEASTTWTIKHNLGSMFITCQIYGINMTLVYPDSIKIINSNTAQVTFSTAQNGYACIVGIQG